MKRRTTSITRPARRTTRITIWRKRTKKTRKTTTATGNVSRASAACAAAALIALALPSTGRTITEIEEATALADSTAARYERAGSYRIEFVQESYWSLADSLIVSEGLLLAQPPSRISISYEDGGRIVSDGDSIWVFVAKTNQFYSAAIDSADIALDPAALLRRYRPDPKTPFVDGDRARRTIQLRPAGGVLEPARLRVTVEADTRTVTSMAALSTAGDRTTYTMVDTDFDVAVPRGAFTARKPPGAERVRGRLPGTP